MFAVTIGSPTTPSAPGPRTRTEIEAFEDLMDRMAEGRDMVLESEMNLEEGEMEDHHEGEVDLDAEVEDMDDDELESSFIDGESDVLTSDWG